MFKNSNAIFYFMHCAGCVDQTLWEGSLQGKICMCSVYTSATLKNGSQAHQDV